MTAPEYLVSYGALGDFGRFYPVRPLACRRGQPVVVRTHRGTEVGTVLGEARPGHAAFLPNTTVGQLLRLVTAEDEATDHLRREQGHRLFDHARRLAAELALPAEVVDVEVLFDGAHAVLHHLRWAEFDPRPFVSTLSKQYGLYVTLQDLTRGGAVEAEEEGHAGCGRPGCGSAAGGGCGDGGCGTAGGCSACGLKKAVDLKAYFAGLRQQMERRPGGPPAAGPG